MTLSSTGKQVKDALTLEVHKRPGERVVALAGNPNVGKSTVFNNLTGMNQHTGNWPGKTVACAQGRVTQGEGSLVLVDIPGTYSLMASSVEEEVARDFILFGGADLTVVVVDATSLERNLNLVLQTLEMTPHVLVCVNLLDEARHKGIDIDLEKLEGLLGVKVMGIAARSGEGLEDLTAAMLDAGQVGRPYEVGYAPAIEQALSDLQPLLLEQVPELPSRWLALRLLEGDESLAQSMRNALGKDVAAQPDIADALSRTREALRQDGYPQNRLRDAIVSELVRNAQAIASQCVQTAASAHVRDRKIDRVLTSRRYGIPIMLGMLAVILWLTIEGANLPSQWLSQLLFGFEDHLDAWFAAWGAPAWLHGLLVTGMYRTLAWVVSVMLPPMAIFFPLFTLLEDLGVLPRIAFNLDHTFRRACAHGKQALTMCMGLGCNACGVVGCRIIESPRERMIAVLTNAFVPCNGRYPTLIAVITMFFAALVAGPAQSFLSTLLLVLVILLGIFMTLGVSKLLSMTVLRGLPSSFALELPPYRKPQIGKVIVRSIFDRTLFVLGRAVSVAAPAGLVIWAMANIQVADASLLQHCAAFLDPFGRAIGLDGTLVLAFILGFPANEIVLPIALMSYLAQGAMMEYDNLTALHALLVGHGWTWLTAVCMLIITLLHFPCATTCLTIKKETGSWGWTALAFALPTVCGVAICFVLTTVVRCLGLV